MILTPNIGFKRVRGKSKQEPPAPSYEPETTAYLNEVGIPDNSDPSIYGITNNAVWVAVDNFIKKLKTDSLLGKSFKLYPKLGNSAAQQSINLVAPNETGAFFGSWVHNETGGIANGTNCYFDTGISFENSTNFGLTITSINEGTGGDSFAVIAGKYLATSSRVAIYSKWGSLTKAGFYAGEAISVDVSKTANGVYSESRNGSNGEAYKDKTVLASSATLSNAIDANNIYEGGASTLSNQTAKNFFHGTIGTTVYHSALTDAETNNLTDAINDLETALNRKTW